MDVVPVNTSLFCDFIICKYIILNKVAEKFNICSLKSHSCTVYDVLSNA